MFLLFECLFNAIGIPTHKDPVLTKLECTDLIVGRRATLSGNSRYARTIHLSATQSDGTVYDSDVPCNFKVGIIPVNPGPVLVEVVLEPRRASAHLIDPVVCKIPLHATAIPPRLRIRAPWWTNVGRLASIGWKAPKADEVMLEIDDGDDARRRAGPPNSAFLHPFTKPGKVILRFIAKDKHSLTSAIRAVRVRQPAPRIRVENRVQCGRPGQSVSFAWTIRDSDECWIELLFRNERQTVNPVGSFAATIATITEEFVLCARGPGGMRRMRLRAAPWIGLENH